MSAASAEDKLLQRPYERRCDFKLKVQDRLSAIHNKKILVDYLSGEMLVWLIEFDYESVLVEVELALPLVTLVDE